MIQLYIIPLFQNTTEMTFQQTNKQKITSVGGNSKGMSRNVILMYGSVPPARIVIYCASTTCQNFTIIYIWCLCVLHRLIDCYVLFDVRMSKYFLDLIRRQKVGPVVV